MKYNWRHNHQGNKEDPEEETVHNRSYVLPITRIIFILKYISNTFKDWCLAKGISNIWLLATHKCIPWRVKILDFIKQTWLSTQHPLYKITKIIWKMIISNTLTWNSIPSSFLGFDVAGSDAISTVSHDSSRDNTSAE